RVMKVLWRVLMPKRVIRPLAIILLFVVPLSGCATLGGIALGPVTGPVSCAPRLVQEVAKSDPDPSWKWIPVGFMLILSPLMGIIAGGYNGSEIDTTLREGKPVKMQDVMEALVDPCSM